MDLRTALDAALRGWWLIGLAMAITAGSSAFLVSRQEPVYQATATLELRPGASLEEPGQVIEALDSLGRSRTTINTVARQATSPRLWGDAIRKLNVPPVVVENSSLTAVVLPETNLIEIRTESAYPELAAAIGNTVAEALAASQAPESALELAVVEPATKPEAPIAPQPVRTITLGVVFGLALGVVAAFLWHAFRSSRALRRTVIGDDANGVGRWLPETRAMPRPGLGAEPRAVDVPHALQGVTDDGVAGPPVALERDRLRPAQSASKRPSP